MKKVLTASLIGILFLSYFGAILIQSNLFGNILSPIVTFICAYYVFNCLYIKEKSKILKISGLLLSMSLFNWVLWDLIWAISDLLFHIKPEQVAIMTYGYTLTSILILSSLVISGCSQLEKWNGIQILLDTIIISAFIMILIWIIFFNKDMQNLLIMKKDGIAMLSVGTDFLIITWTSIWLFSIKKGKISISLKFILIGVLTFFCADTVYYYQYFYSTYEPNSLLDGVYVIAFVFITIGGLFKINTQDVLYENSIKRHLGKEKEILLVAIPIFLILEKVKWEYVLIMLFIIMFYIIFTGYIHKNIFRDEIFEKEKLLNVELEKKVTERTEAITNLLNRDVVTGLYSRRYFSDLLKSTMLNIAKEENLILFYIDLNGYRTIKTVFGNYIGDQILREMGNRLRNYEHSNDYVLASYGEDTFVLFMKGDYTYSQGEEISEKLIELCSDIYQIEEHGIRVTVNIGISIYPNDSKCWDDLIKHADIAMSQSRREGFNKVMTFDEKLGELISAKNNVEIMLKKVNYDEEFTLHYQPQISLKDESIVGFEALIRWKTKSGKFISPGEFIPIAEETGVIIPIGYWVMQEAIRQIAEWDKNSFRRLRIAINISVKQLTERNFLNRLKEELDKNGVSPERIELEIVESIQLEETIEIKDILQKIREMGITIAIDDFGTGYSSLYYLKNLPADRIKISKSLIDRIDEDIYDYNIVKSTISIATVKGITVIAEGVEKKEQVYCLRELQCDEIQGYYFAKPMPAEEAYKKWLVN